MTSSAACASVVCFSRYRFTGKERDAESGNDYFGARYYSSSMGRWLSSEYSMNGVLLELPQSWNKYNYVLNRPLYVSNPNGRCPWCVGAIVGGIVEGGIGLGKQYSINGMEASTTSVGQNSGEQSEAEQLAALLPL